MQNNPEQRIKRIRSALKNNFLVYISDTNVIYLSNNGLRYIKREKENV